MKYELNFTAKMIFESETQAEVSTEELQKMQQTIIDVLLDDSDAKSVEVAELSLIEIK